MENVDNNTIITSHINAKSDINGGTIGNIAVVMDTHKLEQIIELPSPHLPEEYKHIEVFGMSNSTDPKEFRKNAIGLVIFTVILMTITKIVIAGILGLSLFVFLNPITNDAGHKIPSVSHYLKRIDAKLIYFFALLFITVYFMDLSGITMWIDILIERWAHHDTFRIAIGILILTSLLSGLLDDAPITIMFLPIISNLLNNFNHPGNPLFIAFTLGINLGGNFLPQGAACDMMTLELAKKNRVEGFTYRSLTIVGGLFALLHVLLGIGYIYLYITLMGY